MPEYWIQIENKPWDAAPWGINRMTGELLTKDAATGMFAPVGGPGGEALILRRYTVDWTAPDDRKINPWDINERDARVTGGTIPGPTLSAASVKKLQFISAMPTTGRVRHYSTGPTACIPMA